MVDGRAADATDVELALIALVRKAHEEPKLLTPQDLKPLKALVGDGAIDYALVLASFHFINRIADLLHVDSEALPEGLRRFEFLRRMATRVAATMMRKTMDLDNRRYEHSFDQVVAEVAPLVEGTVPGLLGDALAPVRSRPKLVEALRHMIEEREVRSSLDRDVIATVHRTVEQYLAESAEDVTGFHPRPSDPVEAFAMVGTRYAARTTAAMVDALRDAGYDDLGILDLAIAIADANSWARLHRLLGLPATLVYLG